MAKEKRFTLTTQNTNSHGFAVLAAGIDTSRFVENPVMLYNHDLNNIVGTWDDLRLENKTLTAIPKFDDDAASQAYAKKVESGSLRGASVWIEPTEVKLGVEGFPADLPVVTKSILMEASVTPVPSDASALQLCTSKRELLEGEKLNKILLSININNQTENEMKKIPFFIAALLPAGITLKADASEDDLLGVITKLAADKTALELKKTELEGKLTAMETKETTAKTARIEAKVQAAITSGKLKATAKEDIATVKTRWIKLMGQDEESATAILDGMLEHKTLNSQLGGDEKPANGVDYSTWGLKKLSKEAPKELGRIRAEEPERFKKLVAENQ